MTENASRRVDEAELVVDKMFFMGSDSHEYCCPRGISQKLAADQCCSCPVVGLESFGNVEVAAFWSSEKSVDVLCQGAVVHSFWYPEDTILKIKILPMDTRESELYAESTLAAGVVLVVATLNRGLVVYCVGMQCASSEGRFRSAYITELPTDLATTFENFRIRGITATMVGDDALIVTTTSIPQECLPGSSHRVLMSYYSLPDIIAIVCDHIGNDTWSTKESRTAVIMEGKLRRIETFTNRTTYMSLPVHLYRYHRHEHDQGFGGSTRGARTIHSCNFDIDRTVLSSSDDLPILCGGYARQCGSPQVSSYTAFGNCCFVDTMSAHGRRDQILRPM
jgi:hypothetical protein